MKITRIAAAAVVPAAIAGAAISFGTAGHSATTHHDQAASPDRAPGRAAVPGAGAAKTTAQTTAAAKQATAFKPVWVTVKAGQTLSGIASAHHMTWEAIYATPPNTKVLHNPDLVTAGERLRIPADPALRAAQFKAKYAASLAAASQASSGQSASAQSASAGTQSSAQPAASDTYSSAGESAFEQCVAWRESSDTPTDPDGLFGLLPSTWQSLGYSGTAGEASVAVQEQAFAKLYAEDGTQPWAPYDGC
jgi:LysM repeat protein